MNRVETGFTVIGFGMVFFIVGAALLMDKAMVISGNLLIIIGTALLAEANIISLFSFKKIQGTSLFTLGVFFLFKGYTLAGFFLELFGLCILLHERIPSFKSIPRRMVMKVLKCFR